MSLIARYRNMVRADKLAARLIVLIVTLAMLAGGAMLALVNSKASHADEAADKANMAVEQALVALNQANAAIKGSCDWWKHVTELPLAPTTTSVFVFQLIADARGSYFYLRCVPPLPAPDPRIAKLLAPGVP